MPKTGMAESWTGAYAESKGTGSSYVKIEITGEKEDLFMQGDACFDGNAEPPKCHFWGEFRKEKGGVLTLDFGDESGNEGVAEVRRVEGGVALKIRLNRVKERRFLVHYQDRVLEPYVRPAWIPEDFDVGDKWTSPDGRFDVYALYARRSMLLRLVERKGGRWIDLPMTDVVAGILKRDYQLKSDWLRELDIESLLWKDDGVVEITYRVGVATNDPRFEQKDLQYTRVFRFAAGPFFEEIGLPQSEIVTELGY